MEYYLIHWSYPKLSLRATPFCWYEVEMTVFLPRHLLPLYESNILHEATSSFKEPQLFDLYFE